MTTNKKWEFNGQKDKKGIPKDSKTFNNGNHVGAQGTQKIIVRINSMTIRQ